MKIVIQLGVALVVAAGVLSVSSSARADYCGAEGERICLALEKFPSCNVNLTCLGQTCSRPACGAEGQKGCVPRERMKFDPVLQIPVPAVCDQDLKMVNDLCAHPACGRENEIRCGVFQRMPSCDQNLVESGGRCVHPLC